MSDLNELNKKYEKGNKAKEIRDLAKTLEGSDKAAFGIYPSAGKRAKREGPDTAEKAINQAIAGFKSQWSGLDDEGKVGIGKGTPGIYYNTVALPAIAGVVDEKYAPDFAVAADKKAGKIKEAVRKDMGIEEPKGALEHFAYASGEMLGQLPVPGALMNKIVGGAKKMGMAGKVAAAPVEYLSPTIDPKAINYGIGTAFGGGLGMVGEALGEPDHKALGGLIQKYEEGGKVGRFFSAVDKAISTLKQKKGTGEQILKQLESTPGVKQEELETRGIKQKLQASPKITQEELQKIASRNKAPIPERKVLGAGVPEDYKLEIPDNYQKILDEHGFEPVINPDDRRMMAFMHNETGEIVPFDVISGLHPDELGFPVNAQGKMDPEVTGEYKDLMKALMYADKKFASDLPKYNTKYHSYAQPGGENYREVLLHLPQADVQAKNLKQTELHDLLSQDVSGMTEDEARKMNERINTLINDVTDTGEGFRSSHYDTPNILTHFRISDRKGPNGEKVLYVDEIQSDWHQKARDARKDYIKGQLTKERSDLFKQATDELKAAGNDLKVSPENERELQKVVNRLTKERKAELEKAVPKDFGYRRPEDVEKLTELHTKIDRIRNDGLTPEETQEYFTPGRIVPSYGGHDKVLSFNGGESSPRYKETYERKLAQAISAGVDEKTAADWAAKRAADETKYDWSVTVIEVDPKTGEPRNGAQPRTHTTSPANEVKDALIKEAHTYERKVPDAPFKDNWHELATKEILDMAAKEGYDKVAFSPGMEQINRYSTQLRQAVDEVRYVPTPDGGLSVSGIKDGKSVFSGNVADGTFVNGPAQGKSLSEVFGSQIAKQIEEGTPDLQNLPATAAKKMPKMSADDLLARHGDEMTEEQIGWLSSFVQNWENHVDGTPAGEGIADQMSRLYDNWLKEQTLGTPAPAGNFGVVKGDNLTIGGEGMKSFYDKRLPDYVRKYGGKEFDAKSDYTDITMTEPNAKKPTDRDIQRMMDDIADSDDDELMERAMETTHTMADRALVESGLRPGTPEYEDRWWGAVEEFQDRGTDQALRDLAVERLNKVEPGRKLRAFTVDVTPKMKEKITTEGQKLFAASPAIGLGATQVQQPVQEEPKEQAPVQPDEPQGFQEGGRVGKLKDAAETMLRVLHGSPTKVMLEKGKNLDVTTDPGYAVKRAGDKMSVMGQEGPPMVNKFDVPASKLLRFEETYSPEDVAKMKRFFNKLPEGKAMTGEEIYDATGGKDFVLEGLAKAGGFAGYERPAGGSGGIGNWYRVTDQEALTRKARGGLAQLQKRYR